MKFIEASADIPSELIQEVNEGNVIFLCGAGVSRKAELPSFRTLTDGVYRLLNESRDNVAAERIAYARRAGPNARDNSRPPELSARDRPTCCRQPSGLFL
jgi:hypothetical protein